MSDMEETADKPKWLLELENRKRKPRLAHEAGAGAPCTICNSACPGLDLHFWRKICKNCKCSRDDHDVDDDDFPQFHLLFGPTGKYKKKSTLLRVPNKKQHEAESAFEWIPPDTSKELAADYMKALPMEKLPIKGSAGAALRRQLLQKQLPLHDVDYKVCDSLSEDEKKQFEKYLDNLKKYVGQGKVSKMLVARPFQRSFMTPANATDMQKLSPQHRACLPVNPAQLRTPSSFNPKPSIKAPHLNVFTDNEHKQQVSSDTESDDTAKSTTNTDKCRCILNNVSFNQSDIAHSKSLENGGPMWADHLQSLEKSNSCNVPNDRQTLPYELCSDACKLHNVQVARSTEAPFQPPLEGSTRSRIGNHAQHEGAICQDINKAEDHEDTFQATVSDIATSEKLNAEDQRVADAILTDAWLPPSAIHVGDIVGSTLDQKALSFIREKLAKKYSTQEDSIPGAPARALNFATSFGAPCPAETRVKDIGSEKSKATMQTECAVPEKLTYKASPTVVRSEPFASHHHNYKDGKVLSTRLDDNKLDLITGAQSVYGNIRDKPLQDPRFSGDVERNLQPCDEHNRKNVTSDPIAENTGYSPYELANSESVQSNIIYSESLNNQPFPHEAVGTSQKIHDQPNVNSLEDDMERLTTVSAKPQKCHKCREDIRIGDVVVTAEKAKNESWHPGCFACSVCNELLVDLVYFYYKNKLYCGRDLAALLGIPRCFACDELIFVREYTVAEGHNYHVKHFCCWDCDMPLAGQQYISENDRPLCLPCYQKTYAKTCNACNTAIAADQQGVAIKDLNFHANEICFACQVCKKHLLNSKMAVRKDKIFCSKECIATFFT